MNSGITEVMTGRLWNTNSSSEYPETARLRPRDSTYPAGAATATETRTVPRVTSRLFCSHSTTSVVANTLLKFSRVNPPLVVEVTDGVNARNSTTATGTSATIVMSRMSTKRHHCPRVPFSREVSCCWCSSAT